MTFDELRLWLCGLPSPPEGPEDFEPVAKEEETLSDQRKEEMIQNELDFVKAQHFGTRRNDDYESETRRLAKRKYERYSSSANRVWH